MTSDDSFLVRGSGPLVCSSERALSVRPGYVYDVNGYYLALGIDPQSRPTKKDLRLAYHLVGGQGSEWVTYAMKQLLDPEVRDEYDNMPFGERFFDFYEAERIRRKAVDVARAKMAEQGQDLTDLDLLDEHLRGIYNTLGMDVDDGVDDLSEEVQDDLEPAKFAYRYYLWRTSGGSEEDLFTWQALVAEALHRSGLRITFAVGFHDRAPQSWLVAEVGHQDVFFLHISVPPTRHMADQLAYCFTSE